MSQRRGMRDRIAAGMRGARDAVRMQRAEQEEERKATRKSENMELVMYGVIVGAVIFFVGAYAMFSHYGWPFVAWCGVAALFALLVWRTIALTRKHSDAPDWRDYFRIFRILLVLGLVVGGAFIAFAYAVWQVFVVLGWQIIVATVLPIVLLSLVVWGVARWAGTSNDELRTAIRQLAEMQDETNARVVALESRA